MLKAIALKTTGCRVLLVWADRHQKFGGRIRSVERKGILQVVFPLVLYRAFYDEIHLELTFLYYIKYVIFRD